MGVGKIIAQKYLYFIKTGQLDKLNLNNEKEKRFRDILSDGKIDKNKEEAEVYDFFYDRFKTNEDRKRFMTVLMGPSGYRPGWWRSQRLAERLGECSDEETCNAVLGELANYGEAATPALVSLWNYVKDPGSYNKRLAVEVIGNIGPKLATDFKTTRDYKLRYQPSISGLKDTLLDILNGEQFTSSFDDSEVEAARALISLNLTQDESVRSVFETKFRRLLASDCENSECEALRFFSAVALKDSIDPGIFANVVDVLIRTESDATNEKYREMAKVTLDEIGSYAVLELLRNANSEIALRHLYSIAQKPDGGAAVNALVALAQVHDNPLVMDYLLQLVGSYPSIKDAIFEIARKDVFRDQREKTIYALNSWAYDSDAYYRWLVSILGDKAELPQIRTAAAKGIEKLLQDKKRVKLLTDLIRTSVVKEARLAAIKAIGYASGCEVQVRTALQQIITTEEDSEMVEGAFESYKQIYFRTRDPKILNEIEAFILKGKRSEIRQAAIRAYFDIGKWLRYEDKESGSKILDYIKWLASSSENKKLRKDAAQVIMEEAILEKWVQGYILTTAARL